MLKSESDIVRNVTNICFRNNFLSLKKQYSVFPPHYIKPVFRKDEQEALFQSKEAKEISHKQVKPAFMDEICSEFSDARVL